ncbi:MAG: glycerol kinase GlpK [Candidatus Omnitrophota bacterium]
MKYILALDQGTTSSRAILFNEQGRIVNIAQKEFTQIFPQPGWVEHDPEEIWASQMAVAAEVMARAGAASGDIAAIGITNQRETTVVWDRKSGQPIGNAIVWQDRRTAYLCEELKSAGYETAIRQKTGLATDAYFSGTKIKWMLDHIPNARKRAEAGELAFGTVDSWLVWKLTWGKIHITDASNASRTLLYNIHTGEWDEELLAMLEIPAAMLPKACSSSEVYGETAADIFAQPIPIACLAGDQQAALFGQMGLKSGMAKMTYGTGGFLLLNTGAKAAVSKNNLLTTIAWKIGNRTDYALEGGIFIAGAVAQWLRDGLGLIRTSEEIESLAASVADNGGVYMVPAFAGLGAPHWDSYARGIIAGITRGTTAGHIARAALESIAYQAADALEAMEADSSLAIGELRVDVGAAANALLLQFQADILGIPIVRPKIVETTALGAAYLAGLAVGFWQSVEEIAEQWSVDRIFEPAQDRDKVRQLRAGWRKALERSKAWEDK